MKINQYDKMLRLEHLQTPMPPLRLTRLSPRDVIDHMKRMGLKYGAVYEQLYTRFCAMFGGFN